MSRSPSPNDAACDNCNAGTHRSCPRCGQRICRSCAKDHKTFIPGYDFPQLCVRASADLYASPLEPCPPEPAPAMLDDMPKSPFQVVPAGHLFRLTRPGARYATRREADERPGAWLPDGEALPEGWADAFPEDEARSLLPFLRVRGTAGRRAAAPTSADGKLIARACKRLGLSAVALAGAIGAHESVLSRARHGELPEAHRDAIKALLKSGAEKAT